MDDIFHDIYEYVQTLEIIDTHEHLPGREEDRVTDTDVLKEYLAQYFSSDLRSAGLSTEGYLRAIDSSRPLLERWDLVEPYWEAARYTGYGRSLDIAARDLYGIDGISRQTIEPLNEKFRQSLQPGRFHYVLRERSKIKVSLLQLTRGPVDETLFRRIVSLDHFILPQTDEDVRQVESDTGVRVTSFEDWLEACEAAFAMLPKLGAVALKSSLAYQRPIKYERVTRSEAEEDFNEIFRSRHFPGWVPEPYCMGRKFQDYMMHFILRQANRRNLTFQFHTGIQEGVGNIISNSDPALLTNLFLEYPEVDFDLFHMGYPYQQVLSALAKNFPNVYIDMCWGHIISPRAAVDALVEWLDAVPANKISAFGGDYEFVDGVYGHQYLARVNVSKSLAEKVRDGVFDVDKAKEIAKMLFYDNPVAVFKLEGKM